MTDKDALIQPDRGQKATEIRLVDKDGFEAWLKGLSGPQRASVEAQKFTGSGFQLAIVPDGDGWFAAGGVADAKALSSWCLAKLADSLPAGADVTEHAIDSYWDLLHSVPFQAFAELEAAGRTDPAIHALLAPAQAEFDRAQAGDHFLKILHAGAGPRFQASRDLARFMLEGLARSTLTYDKDGRKERLLQVIKRATHMLNRKGDIQDLWPE